MIKLIGPPFHIDPSYVPGHLDDARLHIAATAQKKSGFCVDFLSNRKMSFNRIADYCDLINRKKEVGTFHVSQIYRFTLFPLAMTAGEGIPVIYLDDIFLAHRRYYKAADKLLFIFDATSNYDIIRAQQDIEAYINAKFSEPDSSFMANLVYYISAYPPVIF